MRILNANRSHCLIFAPCFCLSLNRIYVNPREIECRSECSNYYGILNGCSSSIRIDVVTSCSLTKSKKRKLRWKQQKYEIEVRLSYNMRVYIIPENSIFREQIGNSVAQNQPLCTERHFKIPPPRAPPLALSITQSKIMLVYQ